MLRRAARLQALWGGGEGPQGLGWVRAGTPTGGASEMEGRPRVAETCMHLAESRQIKNTFPPKLRWAAPLTLASAGLRLAAHGLKELPGSRRLHSLTGQWGL